MAEKLAGLENLSLVDKYTFSCAPVPLQFEEALQSFEYFAKEFNEGRPVPIRIPKSLSMDITDTAEDPSGKNIHSTSRVISQELQQQKSFLMALSRHEILHKILILYRWLAIRFPKIFIQGQEATEMSTRLESDIFQVLMSLSSSYTTELTARKHLKFLPTKNNQKSLYKIMK